MKKFIIFALVALIFAACGGPSASFSKEYNLTEKHPQTKKAYEMVKKDLSMSRPGAKIVKYTYLGEVKPKDGEKGFYFMKVQVNENGNVSNIDYFFPDDWAFATKDLGRLSRHQLGLE